MSMGNADRREAATPIMLLLSVSLHLFVFFLLFKVSLSAVDRTTSNPQGVTHVSLVDASSAKPHLETISRGPVRMQDQAEPEPLLPQELPTAFFEAERKTISYQVPSAPDAPVIPLKKRKVSPRRIDTAAPDTKKKSDEKRPEKKEDPKDFLEKRLSQIRADVRNRRERSGALGANTDSSGTLTAAATSSAVTDNFVRWFEDVRGRINSHWSILGDNRKIEKIAVIGVKLSDDGRLIDATVDETSGDPMFDKSAMRAVFLASPFPPVPPDIRERIKQAGGLALRFSPGGMQ